MDYVLVKNSIQEVYHFLESLSIQLKFLSESLTHAKLKHEKLLKFKREAASPSFLPSEKKDIELHLEDCSLLFCCRFASCQSMWHLHHALISLIPASWWLHGKRKHSCCCNGRKHQTEMSKGKKQRTETLPALWLTCQPATRPKACRQPLMKSRSNTESLYSVLGVWESRVFLVVFCFSERVSIGLMSLLHLPVLLLEICEENSEEGLLQQSNGPPAIANISATPREVVLLRRLPVVCSVLRCDENSDQGYGDKRAQLLWKAS